MEEVNRTKRINREKLGELQYRAEHATAMKNKKTECGEISAFK